MNLNTRYFKGQQELQVRNCWHFTTHGRFVDVIFRDEEDFIDGMNRIWLISIRTGVIILAFVLMDNHVHFILYGFEEDCKRFMHEYVRRTSESISEKYEDKRKLADVPINYQEITDQRYLKTAICYTLRNPVVAGLPYSPWDYPWSSGPLLFKAGPSWCSSDWDGCSLSQAGEHGIGELRRILKTKTKPSIDIKMIGNLIFPGEYVALDIVEKLFRTRKSFFFFLGASNESDMEARSGILSSLSIPDKDLRDRRDALCLDAFGTTDLRKMDAVHRIAIARKLKRIYNCSGKQIARVCGLVYEEIKDLV